MEVVEAAVVVIGACGLKLKAAAKEAGWKGKAALLPSLPLWSANAEAEVTGGNGGDVLEAMEAAAAAAATAKACRSRSSAKALSRGEMSIIGEVEVVEEVAKGEVGKLQSEVGNFVLFRDEVNMAC